MNLQYNERLQVVLEQLLQLFGTNLLSVQSLDETKEIADYKVKIDIDLSATPNNVSVEHEGVLRVFFEVKLGKNYFRVFGKIENEKLQVNELIKSVSGSPEESENLFREDIRAEKGQQILSELEGLVDDIVN